MKLGSHMTDEQRARCSIVQTGHIVPPGTRAKMSASHKGQRAWNMGKAMTKEERKEHQCLASQKYNASEKGIAYRVTYRAAYHQERLEKGAAYRAANRAVRKWKKEHPEEAAAMDRKNRFKRRTLGFIPINSPFPDADAHHFDKERVAYIPNILHKSVSHNVWTGRNMDKINALAYEWLAQQVTHGTD